MRGPWITEVLLAEHPDVIALQEFDATQLTYSLPGYTFLPGEPTGVSSQPRMIKRSAPISMALWLFVWWQLGRRHGRSR